jgi:predicted nucleic acid-binding protein
MTANKIVVDNSVLIASIKEEDINYQSAYRYFKENAEIKKIIPTFAYFEYQAVLSRIGFNHRYLAVENVELFEISKDFTAQCSGMKLFDLFGGLKGGDLVYACVAKVLNCPLLTFDGDFDAYGNAISIIRP